MEFKHRLKELIDYKNTNAERVSKEIDKPGLSGNTIRNYLNGGKPKNTEIYEILADYFSVSVDYLLGNTNEKSTDVSIKTINKKYGLSEKSLSVLQSLYSKQKDFYPVYKYTEIDTINLLLEDLADNKYSSVINQIDLFLNAQINSDYRVAIQKDGSLQIWNCSETNRTSGIGVIDGEEILNSILSYIQIRLNNLRSSNIESRGEENECSRNRKK